MNRMKRIAIVVGLSAFAWLQPAVGDVVLPAIFSDHMVIQQEKPFKIWGTAQKGEAVSVTLAGQTQTTTADDAGLWSLTLPAMKASFDPMEITVAGTNSLTIKDVLVGEVWLCSGQSNMEFTLAGAFNGPEEAARANNKNIRFFEVGKFLASTPQSNCSGNWAVCSPATAGAFSAVGYFFAKQLQNELNVPVGMIGSYWGGTCIETWIPRDHLEKLDFMKEQLASAKAYYDEWSKVDMQTSEEIAAENDQKQQKAEAEEKTKKFESPEFDDSTWKTMPLPGLWDSSLLPGYDGIVWFRKTVDIPEALAGKDLELHLGTIDDYDISYFNGVEVGRSGSQNPRNSAYSVLRNYTVPGQLVKAGKNVIAVRAIDDFMGGGFGGPPAEMFLTAKGSETKIPLAGDWKYLPFCQFKAKEGLGSANMPYRLYMNMIHPIEGYSMRGAIWYQGESNASEPTLYQQLMPTLIAAWRDKWNDPSLVFIQTQLANFTEQQNAPVQGGWADLREAQTMTAQNDPLAGIAVIIDIGDAADIHPRNKQDVGKRLSLVAREIAYKQPVNAESPMFKSMEIKDNKAYLTFDNVYGGLYAKGGKPAGFAIAGEDMQFVWAEAEIEGDKVVVWSEKVANPHTVHYSWANNPIGNLYNSADLPASPFRAFKKKE